MIVWVWFSLDYNGLVFGERTWAGYFCGQYVLCEILNKGFRRWDNAWKWEIIACNRIIGIDKAAKIILQVEINRHVFVKEADD